MNTADKPTNMNNMNNPRGKVNIPAIMLAAHRPSFPVNETPENKQGGGKMAVSDRVSIDRYYYS